MIVLFLFHLDVLYFSVYATNGLQKNHQKIYTDTVKVEMKASFPELLLFYLSLNPSEICDVEDSPEPLPQTTILPNENSTGLISGIRERLENQEVIEITDTLSGSDCEEVEENPMDLVSNDSFNRVCCGVWKLVSSSYPFNSVTRV